MEQTIKDDFPCLEQARQGNTVTFQNRYLYSRYNPAKEILRAIETRDFLPCTLVLCFSPCLCYGIKELLEKLPENCLVLGIEADKKLHDFTKPFACAVASAIADSASTKSANGKAPVCRARFCFVPREDIVKLPYILNTLNARFSDGTRLLPKGALRRSVAINFSAGVSFHADFYRALDFSCTNAIAQFWKNRVTLTKFGRIFSRNLIRNLITSSRCGQNLTNENIASYTEYSQKYLQKIVQLKYLFKTIDKPIVIFGAGESLEQTALKLNEKAVRKNFYVIAVDAAFSALARHGITADAVVCEEAQTAIADAFIGFKQTCGEKESTLLSKDCANYESNSEITVFAGISSWTGLMNVVASTDNVRIAYFATKYDDTHFFEQLTQDEILPPVTQPLGSVGLTATDLALRLRKNSDIPIYVSGLDFSYSVGATHARGTTAHTKMLSSINRFSGFGNYGAAFGFGTENTTGIDEKHVVTTKALSGYAEEFRGIFAGQKNLFDVRETGLPLCLPRCDSFESVSANSVHGNKNLADADACLSSENITDSPTHINAEKIRNWCKRELDALSELRAILSGEKKLPADERNTRITELLSCREYLYLHFPDGYALSLDTAFLKRIRAEIDFFEKDFRKHRTNQNLQ